MFYENLQNTSAGFFVYCLIEYLACDYIIFNDQYFKKNERNEKYLFSDTGRNYFFE